MVTYRDRFSRQNLFAIFIACSFAIHLWSIIGLLNQIPAWLLRVNMWELAGMIGLTLVFTLAESLIVTIGVIILVALIPGKWFNDKVAILAAVFIWLTSILSAIAHIEEPLVRSVWGVLFLIGYLGFLLGTILLVQRFPKFESGVKGLIDRLAVLTVLYVFVDIVGVVIVVIRNI